MFYSLNFYYLGFSSSISGNLDVRLGCRHRCKDDRVRCGIEGLRRSGSRPVAKQRITPESHEHRVLIGAQIVARFCWASLAIFNCLTLAPFGNRFDIDSGFVACNRCISALTACPVVAQP